MPFTGKPTYAAGADLPELMEDVADLVSVVSPYETPLLDALGDATRSAFSTIHEWVEDELLPNGDAVNQTTFSPDATNATSITVFNGTRFRAGDIVRPLGSRELLSVTSTAGNVLSVVRRYGGSPASALTNNQKLTVISSPAAEGDDKPDTRWTNRVRKRNYTQIFTSTVEVSGSMQATRAYGVPDEAEFQKQQRLRELLRDLENTIINGIAPSANQQGSASQKRSMNGLLATIATNVMVPGTNGIPAGSGSGSDLNEAVLNGALRQIWESASSSVDLIVCGAPMKRRINAFASASRRTAMREDLYSDTVNIYESDFGLCRVLMSRYVPSDTVLLLDSSRVEVLPLQGRSFGYRKLAVTGDRDAGQLIGEYTLECRNELAHGVLRGLS
jgi:hypothetical protein